MNFKPLLLLYLFITSTNILAQTLPEKIADAYSRFKKDAQLEFGISSLTVLDVKTGKVVFAENEEIGLAPASTLKTVTAATALEMLGDDFVWETQLGYTGKISSDGVLKGDVVIKGTGDPTLGSERFDFTKSNIILDRWTDAIKKAGIKKIEGKIIADDSFFGTQSIPLGWIWQDIGNYYGAGSTAVCWNENQFDLIFGAANEVGAPAVLIKTEPVIPYLKIVNEVTTGKAGSGDNVYAYSAPYSDIIYLRGTYGIDLNKKVSASFPDPAFEASFRLERALRAAGIKSENPTTWRRIAAENVSPIGTLRVIDVYSSPRLSQVVYWLNRKSVNLFAENVLKALAIQQNRQASTTDGIEVVQKLWERKSGISPKSLNILDGSGLSPENRVTTKSIAGILATITKEKWFAHFFESLPVYNEMKMKSGTMRNTLAYAGYHTTKGGQQYAFSFIVNNHNGATSAIRQKMFKVLDELK